MDKYIHSNKLTFDLFVYAFTNSEVKHRKIYEYNFFCCLSGRCIVHTFVVMSGIGIANQFLCKRKHLHRTII